MMHLSHLPQCSYGHGFIIKKIPITSLSEIYFQKCRNLDGVSTNRQRKGNNSMEIYMFHQTI